MFNKQYRARHDARTGLAPNRLSMRRWTVGQIPVIGSAGSAKLVGEWNIDTPTAEPSSTAFWSEPLLSCFPERLPWILLVTFCQRDYHIYDGSSINPTLKTLYMSCADEKWRGDIVHCAGRSCGRHTLPML